MYAKVVVDLPSAEGDKLFDYEIPERISRDIGVGSTVAVPFGKSRRLGYVVAVSDSTEVTAEKLKAIDDVVDRTPAFDETTFELCRWLSDEYLCSLAEAVRLVLPPGRSRKMKRIVTLVSEPRGSLSDGKRKICEFLRARGGSAATSDLKRAFGAGVFAQLSELSDKGAIESRYEIVRPAVSEKKERYARATRIVEGEKPESALAKAPKQKEIVNILLEEGEKPVAELLMRSGASYSQMRRLIEKGLVVVEEKPVNRLPEIRYDEQDKVFALTAEQERALNRIEKSIKSRRHEVFLLQGITGSGKTEVYLRAISAALSIGRRAIVLVPEIALTPQMIARFKARFGDAVAVMHSGLSDGERFDQWRGMREGRFRIAVGARSAAFSPLPDLGVIVVDEEHEAAYKQGNNPRYHAKDVAIKRGDLTGATVILGSATPSLESRFCAERGRYSLLRLCQRTNNLPLPEVEIVDMREEGSARGPRSTISALLETRMRDALEGGYKVILLLNRRGFSNYLRCPDCGFVPICGKCAISLTYHKVGRRLKCHHCGHSEFPPSVCPRCRSNRMRFVGAGTQRAEEEVRALFPAFPLVRLDADTASGKHAHQAHLNAFRRGRAAILLGTQMIAKGLDIGEVVLAGVLDADTALHLPDFRAAERTYQLIMQVAGRAGRGERPGRVVVQTHSPDNPAIKAVLDGDYDAFFEAECEARRQLGYPPYSSIIRLLFSSPDPARAKGACEKAARALTGCPGEILGPAPAPLPKIKGGYRYHFLVETGRPDEARKFIRGKLRDILPGADNDISLMIDVDPAWVL